LVVRRTDLVRFRRHLLQPVAHLAAAQQRIEALFELLLLRRAARREAKHAPEGGVCAGGVAAPAAQVSDRHARAMPSLRTGTDFMQNPSGWSPLRLPRLRAADTGGTATFTPLHKVLH